MEPVFFLRKQSREDACDSLVNSVYRSETCLESSWSFEIQMGRLSVRKTKLCRASMAGGEGSAVGTRLRGRDIGRGNGR